LQAALGYLETLRTGANDEGAEIYEDLSQQYRRRLANLAQARDASLHDTDSYKRFNDLSRELLGVERRTAVSLRNQRRISDELLRRIEHELDLGEVRLAPKS